MLKAYDAHNKSVINGEAKIYISNIIKAINDAVDNGRFEASISIDLLENDYGQAHIKATAIREAIVKELELYGYTVKFEFAKPLPSGCPSDQWNFNNGYVHVKW